MEGLIRSSLGYKILSIAEPKAVTDANGDCEIARDPPKMMVMGNGNQMLAMTKRGLEHPAALDLAETQPWENLVSERREGEEQKPERITMHTRTCTKVGLGRAPATKQGRRRCGGARRRRLLAERQMRTCARSGR